MEGSKEHQTPQVKIGIIRYLILPPDLLLSTLLGSLVILLLLLTFGLCILSTLLQNIKLGLGTIPLTAMRWSHHQQISINNPDLKESKIGLQSY